MQKIILKSGVNRVDSGAVQHGQQRPAHCRGSKFNAHFAQSAALTFLLVTLVIMELKLIVDMLQRK